MLSKAARLFLICCFMHIQTKHLEQAIFPPVAQLLKPYKQKVKLS